MGVANQTRHRPARNVSVQRHSRALTPPGGEDEEKTLIMGCESGKYLMEIPYWLLCTVSIGLSELERILCRVLDASQASCEIQWIS